MRCARCGSCDVRETPATRMASTWFWCYRCGQAMRPPHKTVFYLLVGIGAPIVGMLLAVVVVGMAGMQMPRRLWILLVMMPITALFFGAMCLYKLFYPEPQLDAGRSTGVPRWPAASAPCSVVTRTPAAGSARSTASSQAGPSCHQCPNSSVS